MINSVFPLFLVFGLAGLPLFLAIGGLALAGFFTEGLDLRLYFAEFLRLTSSPLLASIPLFTFSGYILAHTGAPRRLLLVARKFLGWIPGGVGIVALILLAIFTSFTGASGVTIVALGGLFYPMLRQQGFSPRFTLGLITSGGSVGLLFPPSLPLIIYAILSEVPVQHLFIAGVLPGLILVLSLSAFTWWKSVQMLKNDHQSIDETLTDDSQGSLISLKEDRLTVNHLWEALIPIIVIGSIYLGWATITETAILLLCYVIAVEWLIHRDLNWKLLYQTLIESVRLSGGILIILGSALALTNYIIYIDLPGRMLGWIGTWIHSKWAFLLALNIFLLIVGCLMDIFSALVVVVPLILPLVKAYGVDPIHLGIIFLVNLEIGYSTPPVGLNLFISSYRFGKPVLEVYRATLPFIGIGLIVLLLVTYFPFLSLSPVHWFIR